MSPNDPTDLTMTRRAFVAAAAGTPIWLTNASNPILADDKAKEQELPPAELPQLEFKPSLVNDIFNEISGYWLFFSPDGRLLAVMRWGHNKTQSQLEIQVVSTQDGKEKGKLTLEDASNIHNQCSLSHDNKIITIASGFVSEARIRSYYLDPLKKIEDTRFPSKIKRVSGDIQALTFSSDFKRYAAVFGGSERKPNGDPKDPTKVEVLNLKAKTSTIKTIAIEGSHPRINWRAFSSDLKMIAVEFVSKDSAFCSFSIINTATGKKRRLPIKHPLSTLRTRTVNDLDFSRFMAFSPDDKLLVVCMRKSNDDSSLQLVICDVIKNAEIRTVNIPGKVFYGVRENARLFAFSPSGRWFALAGEDHERNESVVLFDTSTWKAVRRFSHKLKPRVNKTGKTLTDNFCMSLAFSPDSRTLAGAGPGYFDPAPNRFKDPWVALWSVEKSASDKK